MKMDTTRSLLAIAILTTFASQVLATSSVIVPPVRQEGDEVAVIFVPGAGLEGEAYLKTAVAMQAASSLRLWVALTTGYSFTVNPLELPSAINDAINKLKQAGMKSDKFVGVAHSLGGVFLAPYAKTSDLKAVVLMGSYINRNDALHDYPLPLLTLSAELDGQARITRIAVEFAKLLKDMKKSPDAIYKTPVINMKGSSHAQFASGVMPDAVKKLDLQPEVSETVAHQMIGRNVDIFLTANFGTDQELVDLAKTGLAEAHSNSSVRFQPLLDVKDIEFNGTTSPWAVVAQREIARSFQNRTKVTNTIKQGTDFTLSKPEMHKIGDTVNIAVTSTLHFPINPLDISTTLESANEIDVKMKSYAAILQILNVPPTKNSSSSCVDVNQKAVDIALKHATPESRQRYLERGRPITFKEDIVYGTGIQWVESSLGLGEDDAGLHVQSIALEVSVDSPLSPGEYYCKLLTPYRAMEWIHVDSLRKHKA